MTSPTADLADHLALDASAQDLLFRHARSANTFTDEPVSDEQVAALYDLIKWGPTAMNTQPLRLVVVRSAEAKARLVGHMFEGNQAKTPLVRSAFKAWPLHLQPPVEAAPHRSCRPSRVERGRAT